jgi:signal transduction histidine kinase
MWSYDIPQQRPVRCAANPQTVRDLTARRVRSRIDPFVAIELLIVVSAQMSVFFSTDHVRVPLWVLSAECFAFSALRLGFEWFRARPKRLVVLAACELAILSAAVLQTRNGTIIVLSLAFVLRNAELLPPVRAAVISGVTLGLLLLATLGATLAQGQSWGTILDSLVELGMAIGISGALASFAANERRASLQLQAAHEELRLYAERAAQTAAERERARIAADLHDAIGHSLTALNVQLQSAIRMRASQPTVADELLGGALGLGEEALASVRETVSQLRRDPLERDPLDDVLHRVLARHERAGAPKIVTRIEPCRLDVETGTAFVRIAEEAVVNAIKHASAGLVRVDLFARAGAVCLEIIDDGCGFEPREQASGHGLNIMRERANALRIAFALESSPGSGTRIALESHGGVASA